jgi:very-short-patch-repair endonuclease
MRETLKKTIFLSSIYIKMKRIEQPFYYDASIEIIRRAAALRKNQTDAEKVLWIAISKGQLNGLHFRRQHPINKFIVDFYCHEILLIIELDGDIHNKPEVAERDEGREHELRRLGLHVIRFSNYEVLNNLQQVLAKIKTFAKDIK